MPAACDLRDWFRARALGRSAFFALLLLLLVSTNTWAQEAKKGQLVQLEVGADGRGGAEVFLSREKRSKLSRESAKQGWKLVAVDGGIDAQMRFESQQELVLSAAMAVLWAPEGDGAPFPLDSVRALYAEGAVSLEIREPGQAATRVEAERVFVDLGTARALIFGARIRVNPAAGKSSSRGGLDREPVFLNSERLSVFGAAELIGQDVQVTGCDFGKPHYAIRAGTLRITAAADLWPAPVLGLGGAAANVDVAAGPGLIEDLVRRDKVDEAPLRDGDIIEGSDRLSDLKDSPRWLSLEDVRLEALDQPLLYLPKLLWRSDWDFFPQIRYGNSSIFGNFVSVDWNFPILEPDRVLRSGRKLREGLAAQVKVGASHSSTRGTSENAGVKAKYYHRGKAVGKGRVEGTYLDDEGRDQSGAMLQRRSRSWFYAAQQLEVLNSSAVDRRQRRPGEDDGLLTPYLSDAVRDGLAGSLRLDAEHSQLSDRGYLLEFEERIAKTDKQQESYIYTHLRRENLFLSALTRLRANDFEDYVERRPELVFDLMSEPLYTDRWFGSQATASLDMSFAALRLRPDDDRFNVDSEVLNRFDSGLEIDEKLPLGPFVARGYSQQRFTAVDRAVSHDGGLERFSSAVGLNLATTLSRRYAERFVHVIVPELGYFNRYMVSRDPSEFIPVDDVENERETEFIFLRARTRLSVERALAEDEARPLRVDYYDLIDFAVETRYYPSPRSEGRSGPFPTVFSDLRFFLPGNFEARLRVETDTSRSRVVTNESYLNWLARPGMLIGASYRDLDGVAQALGWNLTWTISAKWALRLEEQYDFLTSRFITHRATVRRRFHRFALDFALSVDPGENDVSFSVQLAPDLFGSSQDPFRQGRLSGISY